MKYIVDQAVAVLPLSWVSINMIAGRCWGKGEENSREAG